MYRVTHGDDVYVCQGAELESGAETLTDYGGAIVRRDYDRSVCLKQIISINGRPTHLDYAEKSIYVTKPFTITIAEEP